MVAAWIKAETGVGPSIASGNHICSGNMADLPAPPINTSNRAHDSVDMPKNEVAVKLAKYGEPANVRRSIITKKSSVLAP